MARRPQGAARCLSRHVARRLRPEDGSGDTGRTRSYGDAWWEWTGKQCGQCWSRPRAIGARSPVGRRLERCDIYPQTRDVNKRSTASLTVTCPGSFVVVAAGAGVVVLAVMAGELVGAAA